jgi:hypothetical protein
VKKRFREKWDPFILKYPSPLTYEMMMAVIEDPNHRRKWWVNARRRKARTSPILTSQSKKIEIE